MGLLTNPLNPHVSLLFPDNRQQYSNRGLLSHQSVSSNWRIYASEGHILLIALKSEGLEGIHVSHTFFLGPLSGRTGNIIAGPTEPGGSQSVGLVRKDLEVNLRSRHA